MKRLFLLGLAILLLLAGPVGAQNGVPDDAILYIPAIYLDRPIEYAPIVEIDGLRVNDVASLEDGVAWLEGTAWFTDADGRVALAGHNPGAFTDLDAVEPGDMIYIFIGYDTFAYEVIEKRVVNPAESQYLRPDNPDESTLVLVTCSNLRRLVVIAERNP